jgi:hypothetical protein
MLPDNIKDDPMLRADFDYFAYEGNRPNNKACAFPL